jgi:hypothetical protein
LIAPRKPALLAVRAVDLRQARSFDGAHAVTLRWHAAIDNSRVYAAVGLRLARLCLQQRQHLLDKRIGGEAVLLAQIGIVPCSMN